MPKMNCGVPVGVHRRSARRDVDAAGDVLAVATDRLSRAEELAAPTRRRVNELHNLIDDHRRMDSTRRMFDQFNDLEGVARDAGRLCHALDQWKHWANGRTVVRRRVGRDRRRVRAITTTDRASASSPRRSLSGRSDEDLNSNRRRHPHQRGPRWESKSTSEGRQLRPANQ